MRRKLLRITSLVLAIHILTTAIAPTLLYALTAGPTAPEYTSFEPVDATDMVNLATGDFTYNIPLLEVPGPEGGYPITLSYHAGISPEEEASWVGLGWNINVGAINRIVNVHPDDLNNSTVTMHDEWSGGETKIYTLGIGVTLNNSVNIGLGVNFAKDTYKGTGIGLNASAGVGTTYSGSKVGIGVQAGLGPYGGSYAGLGLRAGTAGSGLSAASNIGISASFNNSSVHLSGNAGASVSIVKPYGKNKANSFSLVEADISTSGGGLSTAPAGVSITSIGDNSTNVTSRSSGLSIPIPIPYTPLNINLGYHKTRYYIDAHSYESQLGVLYSGLQDGSREQSYDSYFLKSALSTSPFYDIENTKGGGSMPAYDSYNVLAQGLSGAIQPYLFEGGTITRKVKWTLMGEAGIVPELGYTFDHTYKSYSPDKKVSFRFINDFSNSMVIRSDNMSGGSLEDFKVTNSSFKIGYDQLGYNNSASRDFNSATGALAGSKHVEWFTNGEINEAFFPDPSGQYPNKHKAKGFIPNITDRNAYFSNGLYGSNAKDNIGGFMITNSSGVNYHYGQPVYNFEETHVAYAETKASKGENTGISNRRIEKNTPYAYTWLLTGITGPDYVDRGVIGVIDEADWGYWVKFEYGKWTDQYIWRTPNDGNQKDMWSGWQSFDAGKKELYYLDAIVTRTHTALFVKDIRRDGKGAKSKEAGGFGVEKNGDDVVTNCSASSLRLSRVLLYNNRMLSKALEEVLSINEYDQNESLKTLTATRDELKSNAPVPAQGGSNMFGTLHYWNNVLTERDLANMSGGSIAPRALRQIVMNQDYSLCRNTPNSIDIDYSNFSTSSGTQTGKLSLLSVDFLGYEGRKIIPSTSFSYHNPVGYEKDKKDVWGMYKSDVDVSSVDSVYQATTLASSGLVHAWSLTGISTGLGADIEIEYESDRYKQVVLAPFYTFPIKSINVHPHHSDRQRVRLHTSESLMNIPELNRPNRSLELNFSLLLDLFTYHEIASKSIDIPIQELGADYIDFNTSDIAFRSADGNWTTGLSDLPGLFFAGYVKFARSADTETFGGGLRVASVALKADGITNKTKFIYGKGVTSYEPFELKFNMPAGYKLSHFENCKSMVNDLMKEYIEIVSNTMFLPSPGVMYEEVTILDEVIDEKVNPAIVSEGLSYTSFKFQTFNRSMLPRHEEAEIGLEFNQVVKKVTFRDFRSMIGALKESTVRSAHDHSILRYTRNNYLHDLTANYHGEYGDLLADCYNNQGRVDHMYYELMNSSFEQKRKLFITEIEEFPVVATGQRVENQKTGIVKESKVIGFDYYTGNPLNAWYKDGMGNHYLKKVTPAYMIPQYSGMGLKVINTGNKHMLSQSGLSYLYLVTPLTSNPCKEADFSKTGVLTASAEVWKNNGAGVGYPVTTSENSKNYPGQGIWIKSASYSWIGDEDAIVGINGVYPYSDFSAFDYSTSAANAQWQLAKEVTQFDVYSHALESRDLNNKYSAMLMDPLNIQVTATADLASRQEIAYSGAEFNTYYRLAEGAVSFGNGSVSPGNPHTGMHSLAVGGGGKKGFTFTFKPESKRFYRASVWVYQPGGVRADGTATEFKPKLIARDKHTGAELSVGLASESRKARGFYLLTIDIKPENYLNEIEVFCLNDNQATDKPQYYDDFRVHPLDAAFTSYVYDLDKGWLTHILDQDNMYSRFEYDHAGKLKAVYRELFRINEKTVTTGSYNYGK